MLSAAAVRVAQSVIVRSYRLQPIHIKAALPFDPHDAEDVGSWLRVADLFEHPAGRYDGDGRRVTRSLLWDARDAVRKGRAGLPRDRGLVFVGTEQAADVEGAIPPEPVDWFGAVERLADVSGAAAARIVGRARSAAGRKARAVLSCLGRLFAIVRSVGGAIAADQFWRLLRSDELFRHLPLRNGERDSFAVSLRTFASTGNIRTDLIDAGLHGANTRQWNEFRTELASIWRERGYDGGHLCGNILGPLVGAQA
jgi:hypothetical protein